MAPKLIGQEQRQNLLSEECRKEGQRSRLLYGQLLITSPTCQHYENAEDNSVDPQGLLKYSRDILLEASESVCK